jgi:rubrerythrin
VPITFNADEVFEIAEEIERSASKFYRQAAATASDEKTKKTLEEMAGMEADHEQTFKQMRKDLTEEEKEPTAFDPEGEAAMYLQAMADAHGTEGKLAPMQPLTGRESIKEIFEIALKAEKDSVIYYFGIKSLVPRGGGKGKVDEIIKEELRHIRTLNQYLKEAS